MLDKQQPEEVTMKTRTLKLRGDIVYVPKIRVHSFGRSQSIPEITFRAELHGRPEDGHSYEIQDSETSSSPMNLKHSDAKSTNRVLPMLSDYPRPQKETTGYVPNFTRTRNYSDNSDDSPQNTRIRRVSNQARSNRDMYPEYVNSNSDYRPQQHW